MAWYIARVLPGKEIYVTTYGAPRVGNRSFVRFMLQKCPQVHHLRVVLEDDWVPQTPFFGRYLHYGQEVLYKRTGSEETVSAWIFPLQDPNTPQEEYKGAFRYRNTELFAAGTVHNLYERVLSRKYVPSDFVDDDVLKRDVDDDELELN